MFSFGMGPDKSGIRSERLLAIEPSGLFREHVSAITCVSMRGCVALGNGGTASPPFSERWDGKAWRMRELLNDLKASR